MPSTAVFDARDPSPAHPGVPGCPFPDDGSPAAHAEDMQRHIDAAYDAWKEADAAARELLGAVHEAWYRYDMGLGVPPSSKLVGQAAGLRHEASEKLARAIQMLHDAGLIQPAPKRPSRPRLVGGLQFGRRFQ